MKKVDAPLKPERDGDGFYKLAKLANVPDDGTMLQVEMEDAGVGVEVALARVDGKLYAFRDICPHMAFPLSVGYIEGEKLTCVGHGWEFNLKSGKTTYPPVRKGLTLYENRVDGEDVWVKVDPLY